MPDRYLALWLEAPLQSWGFDSHFYCRDTLDFPTRSGVLGLLLCALGAGGEQTEWLASMQGHSQTVYAFSQKRKLDGSKSLRLADFHMVGGGYDDSDPWQSLLIPKTSEGKKAVGGGTKITYRQYIQDVAFGVVLSVPEALASQIAAALQEPVWSLYLGRKCCVPTDTVFRGIYENPEAAKKVLFQLATDKELSATFTVFDGRREESDEVLTLNDIPVQFGHRKIYRDRVVSIVYARDAPQGGI